MAELDYAFLADYARVDANGTLTAIGASWTYLSAPELPTVHQLAVAGRVRAHIDEGPIPVRVEIIAPDDSFRVASDVTLERNANARPYGDGYFGHIFAFTAVLPIPKVGLYTVRVLLETDEVRVLRFDVITGNASATS